MKATTDEGVHDGASHKACSSVMRHGPTQGIEITDIKIKLAGTQPTGSHLVGHAKIVFNGVLAVANIRIVNGKFGRFVSFPRDSGSHSTTYPITQPMQDYLSEKILREYNNFTNQHQKKDPA